MRVKFSNSDILVICLARMFQGVTRVLTLNWIAVILVIVGALNWGLVGFFKWDLVAAIFGGERSAGARVVYALVGLAGLYLIFVTPQLLGGNTW